MRKLTATAILAVSAFCSTIPIRVAVANGWEHGAVPYRDLLRALSFDDYTTRAHAARSLGLRGRAEAAAPLIALLDSEAVQAVRIESYSALGKLDSPQALTSLLRCLNRPEVEAVRAACISALADSGGEHALSRLIVALDDKSFLVRSAAVDGLGRFADILAVESLEAVYRGDNQSLKRRTLHALGMTGMAQSAPVLLEALANASDDGTRLMVVKGLGNSGAGVAAVPLKNLQRQTDNPVLRTAVVIALGSIAGDDRLGALVSFLQDELPAVRFVALQSLRELENPRAVSGVVRLATVNAATLANLSIEAMRAQPLETLGLISEQVLALETLTDLAPGTSPHLFLAAAATVGIEIETGADANLAAAIFRLQRAALYGLGYSGSDAAWKFLTGADGIGNADFRLQSVSIRSLGVLEKPHTAPLLLSFLKHEAAEVRWTTASVLGRIGGSGAVEGLLAALDDPQKEVRRQAALGLGYQKAVFARSALTRLARREARTGVGQAARFALELIGD